MSLSDEWVEQHECGHDQVLITEDDADVEGNLRVGDNVLVPCRVCGETPLDTLSFLEARAEELQAALLAHDPDRPLFHWAPAARRKQIVRYGLRPNMRATTTTGQYGAPAICLGDSPSWAWALSGEMSWTPEGEWDLWQTTLGCLQDPLVLASPERKSGIYEVRVEHRIYKRDVWYVGSRVK